MRITGGKVLCLVHKPTGQRFALLADDNCYGADAIDRDAGRLSNHMANISNIYGKISLKEFSLQIISPNKK